MHSYKGNGPGKGGVKQSRLHSAELWLIQLPFGLWPVRNNVEQL